MSFIEIPLEGTQEEKSVPENVHSLRVESVTEKKNAETGRLSYMCVIRIEDPPEEVPVPAAIFHYLWLPLASDEEKTVQLSLIQIKRFLTAFEVPYEGNGFSPEDIPGASAEVLLTEEEYEGVMRNNLRLPAIEE